MVSIGGTVTNGIQDISALLPLLGTEQCEKHVSCALDKGFLYAAAAPLSIFGSLGVVKAGLRVLLASLNFRHFKFVGAKWLEDAGFAPDGTAAEKNNVVSLMALDGSRFVAEARLDAMLQQLKQAHFDDVERVCLDCDCFWWNIQLASSAVVAALLALTPYVPLIFGDFQTSQLFWTSWFFPVMRAVGTSLTAVAIQFVLQLRILEIIRKRLFLKQLEKNVEFMKGVLKDVTFSDSADECIWSIKQKLEGSRDRNHLTSLSRKRHRISRLLPHFNRNPLQDTETAPATPSISSQSLSGQRVLKMLNNEFPSYRAWFLLLFQACILFGAGMSVVGYIGCFSVVQTSSKNGPLVWVAVEIALSLLRIVIWASNPEWDNDTKVQVSLILAQKPPTITCSSPREILEELQTLPVLSADDFLKDIAIYTGPIEQFLHERITLYYTLTGSLMTHQKVLYVIIFDPSQSATWALYIDPNFELRSILRGATLKLNTTNNTLQVKLHDMVDASRNPITRDQKFTEKLKEHCRSIMRGIMIRAINPHTIKLFRFWSLSVKTQIAAPRASIEADRTIYPWPSIDKVDELYLQIGESQRILAAYAEKRREWIVECVKVLRVQSLIVTKERRQRIPESPASEVLLAMESYISALIDLEAQEGLEILWLCEVSALTKISSHYLHLVASSNGGESPHLRSECSQTMAARYSYECEASQARIRNHNSELLAKVNDEAARKEWTEAKDASYARVNQLWREAFNEFPDHFVFRMRSEDKLQSFDDFISRLRRQWSAAVSTLDVSEKKYMDLITTKVESTRTAHGSEMRARPRLPTYLDAKRNRIHKQWEAEKVSMDRRLSTLLREPLRRRVLFRNLPFDSNSLASLSHRGQTEQLQGGQVCPSPLVAEMIEAESATETLPVGFNLAEAEAEDGHLQIKATLEPYLQSDLPTLAGIIMSNRRHADIMLTNDLAVDEFCEMVNRNQSMAVVSLYNMRSNERFLDFLDALRGRTETLTSLVVERVQLDSDTFTALLDVVKNNSNIVSVQLRDNPSALDTERLDAAVLHNRQTIELPTGRTTDFVYDYDDTGFRIHTGLSHWSEKHNKCTVYFDTPQRTETTLHIRVVVEKTMFGDIQDDTKDPFILRLNVHKFVVNRPRTAQDEHHYRIAIEKTLLHDQSRNQLVITANPEYGSNAFFLNDLDIIDDQGYVWEGNIIDTPESSDNTAAVPVRPPSAVEVDANSTEKLSDNAPAADVAPHEIIEPPVPSGSFTTDNAQHANGAGTQNVGRMAADENPAIQVVEHSIESCEGRTETLVQRFEDGDGVWDAVEWQSTLSTEHRS